MNTQIKTTTKTINERIISSEWIIAKTLFQCTTIYAPAKSNKRYKWYQENITEKLLHSDIITGDFNVDCSVDNNLNKYIKTIFQEFQFTELKNGITFPKNGSIIDRAFVSKKILHLNPTVTTKEIKLKSQHASKSIKKLITTTKNSKRIPANEEINNILKEQEKIKQANQINIHINNKETPTKYLTRRLKVQRKTNEIPQILDLSNNRLIDQKILDQINQPIEEYEIRLGIEKIQEGKAPGKDGLLPTFYKNHINEILPTSSKLYNHFWNSTIPKEFKQGILIIIYKNKGDLNNLDNYRPITLLNIDYKIYSKIINNRILKFLNKVISPFQTGFVPKRLLHENIITLNPTIEIIKKEINTKDYMKPIITFYDFEKAFESISHNSILRTLAHLKLPLKMVLTII
ncbi:hypothetical protein ACTFIY_008888 [Dictyostelium cf. discoideum]